jgi:hypothetical protein
MTTKPKRVVLGEGHPWFSEFDRTGYTAIQLTVDPVAASILLRGGEKNVNLKTGGLGNWNRIRLVAEILPPKKARKL